jgi:DNA polymerase I
VIVLSMFDAIWCVDFEYYAPEGESPVVHCMAAKEFFSGQTMSFWRDDLERMFFAPFDTGKRSLVVSYYAAAEASAFLSLGWPLPERMMDLFVEFRRATNRMNRRKTYDGRKVDNNELPHGRGLLGALLYYGLSTVGVTEKLSQEKEERRGLAMRGTAFSAEEKAELMSYCEQDADAAYRLLKVMELDLDHIGRCCMRGRYSMMTAVIERNGIPIDVEMLNAIRNYWEPIKASLISKIDPAGEVYDDLTFKLYRWEEWLERHSILQFWPRLTSGRVDMSKDVRKKMSSAFLEVAPWHELITTLSDLRLEKLVVGSDGRNRVMSSVFGTVTGRNTPRSNEYIMGPARWLRSLIKPEPGRVLVNLDWAAEEFAIAGVLANDANMKAAYNSPAGPYLGLAIQMGDAPSTATKETHDHVRNVYKVVSLATNYDMGTKSLSQSIGRSEIEARQLWTSLRTNNPDFWKYSDGALDFAMTHGFISNEFGWIAKCDRDSNPKAIRNFPVQSTGSEILHLAVCLAIDRGVQIDTTVHDSMLIEASEEDIAEHVIIARDAMLEASRTILGGFEIRVDGWEEANWIRYPNRYMDRRGAYMWNTVCGLLNEFRVMWEGDGQAISQDLAV